MGGFKEVLYGIAVYALLIFGGTVVMMLAERASNELGQAIFGW